LPKNILYGYLIDNTEFKKELSNILKNIGSTAELIDLNSLTEDELKLYFSVLDEVVINSSNIPQSLLENLQNSKPFLRLIDNNNIKPSLNDIETEYSENITPEELANRISYRKKLVTELKKEKTSENEKNLKFIMQLVSILEDKDPYTRDHSARVAKYALAIAEPYFSNLYDTIYEKNKEISEEQFEKQKHEFIVSQMNLTMLVAWAHDIGKNSIATNLLNKDSKLTVTEYDMIKMHTDFGAQMIRRLLGDEDLAEAIENHHERIDGNGYHKLEEFSDIAKIIAIADSFDAMTTTRPYTTKLENESKKNKLKTIPEAINELQISSHLHLDIEKNIMSQQLDTTMTDIFVKILKRDLALINEGNSNDVTVLKDGLDENGYIKSGYWDDKTQLYVQDKNMSQYSPKLYQ